MTGKWLASQRRNRKGMYTVHYQMPGGNALCGRPFTHTREPTIDGSEWDIHNIHTCECCKALYILFFHKGIPPDPVSACTECSK